MHPFSGLQFYNTIVRIVEVLRQASFYSIMTYSMILRHEFCASACLSDLCLDAILIYHACVITSELYRSFQLLARQYLYWTSACSTAMNKAQPSILLGLVSEY